MLCIRDMELLVIHSCLFKGGMSLGGEFKLVLHEYNEKRKFTETPEPVG